LCQLAIDPGLGEKPGQDKIEEDCYYSVRLVQWFKHSVHCPAYFGWDLSDIPMKSSPENEKRGRLSIQPGPHIWNFEFW
jgi:hypothetical protein